MINSMPAKTLFSTLFISAISVSAMAADVKVNENVVSLEGVSATKFNVLPDNAKVRVGKNLMTKGELDILRKQAVDRANADKASGAGRSKVQTTLPAVKTKLQQDFGAKVGAQNSQALAEFGKYKFDVRTSGAARGQAPTISAVMGTAQNGAYLMIKGDGFGDQPGKILLKGAFPGGQIELVADQGWASTYLAAKLVLPNGGALDQNDARIQVISKDGRISAEFPNVAFRAELDTEVLYIDGGTTTCSDAAWANTCKTSGYEVSNLHIAFPDGTTYTGTDKFSTSLKNGWKYGGWGSMTVGGNLAFGEVTLSGENPDSSQVDLSFNWKIMTQKIDPITSDALKNFTLWYRYGFYIRGPKGLPWK